MIPSRWKARSTATGRTAAGSTLAMLEASDVAAFLPDYQESRGAMVEWAWCQRTGKDCAMYLDMTGGRTQ